MQLLRSSALPATEFVSLSLLMRQDHMDRTSASMGEPLIIVSPLSTIANRGVLDALHDLHTHLTYVGKSHVATKMNQSIPQDKLTVEMLQEDDKNLSELQVFRSFAAGGMGLYYRLVRDDGATTSSLSSLVMTANKNGGRIDSPPGLSGVVVCVGLSGLPVSHSVPTIQYSLAQRINDCITVLARIGINDVSAAKSMLSTFLLAEDELRKTNSMTEASSMVSLPEVDLRSGLSPIDLIAPVGRARKGRRASLTGGGLLITGGGNHNNSNNTPTEYPVQLALEPSSSEAAKTMTDRLLVLSVVETDTFLRKYEMSAQERKANLDLTGGTKSKLRRRTRDADFDNFDYKGPQKESVTREIPAPSTFLSPPNDTTGKLHLRPSKADTRSKGAVPVLSASRNDAATNSRRPRSSGDDSSSKRSGQLQKFTRRDSVSGHGDEDGSEALRPFGSNVQDMSGSVAASSVASQTKVQVNVALNEDLSCSYRNSQLSSCSIEGVVQVQVKSSARSAVPFHLLLRDPSSHVGALQENGKFAENISASIEDDEEADRKFAVNVPKADSYFPVFKYRCTTDLRPVPIRVQTKVKADKGFCRVALQISSNPNNTASLTDLTIVMNVPDDVQGESLVTQPAGGVWDDSKQSVVWFVSELGVGEKFQLQARFEMASGGSQQEISFPVLVRCQCLFSQLTDVELEVRDTDSCPADMTMKIARRFRLSHRERS